MKNCHSNQPFTNLLFATVLTLASTATATVNATEPSEPTEAELMRGFKG